MFENYVYRKAGHNGDAVIQARTVVSSAPYER
jgi:hypothetical protein